MIKHYKGKLIQPTIKALFQILRRILELYSKFYAIIRNYIPVFTPYFGTNLFLWLKNRILILLRSHLFQNKIGILIRKERDTGTLLFDKAYAAFREVVGRESKRTP